jgi:hypothetical protein
VNVTINGIPYNDSESHGTYWVNMPISFISWELQLQRGVEHLQTDRVPLAQAWICLQIVMLR